MGRYRVFIKPSAVREIERIAGKKPRQRIIEAASTGRFSGSSPALSRSATVLRCLRTKTSTHLPAGGAAVPRMTITLSVERQRALKEAAARRGTTITAVIDQSLELAGIRTRESAAEIVGRARARARMGEEQAMSLALRETAAVREKAATCRAPTTSCD